MIRFLLFACISASTFCTTKGQSPNFITLGGILDSRQSEKYFTKAVQSLNLNPDFSALGIHFNSTTMLMDSNPIRSALSVCDNMLTRNVSAMVVSHPPEHQEVSPISVSYTCGFYKIPVIGIAARDSTLSDKRVHSSFVRTLPPYSHQANLWIKLLLHFGWKKVIFMHTTNEEGWSIFHRFQGNIVGLGIEIEGIVRFPIGLKNYTAQLSSIGDFQSRVFLLYANKEEAEVIFEHAHDLDLFTAGHVLIVTEQLLHARNIPIGSIGSRLINSTNLRAHIHDSTALLAKAFASVSSELDLYPFPGDCTSKKNIWRTGGIVFERLKRTVLGNGMTGHVEFDSNGDRVDPVYEVINIHSEGPVVVGIFGSRRLTKSKPLFIMKKKMVYMGNIRTKPQGILVSTHLRILTLLENPFIYARNLSSKSCKKDKNETICTHTNSETGETTEYCCWGFCVDLMYMLAKSCNFTFEVHLSKDGYYGSHVRNKEGKFEWNGMVGELIRNEGDIIIGALTMTPERAQQIDFTQPFKYLGLTILVKTVKQESKLSSFLQPFQDTLWILVGLSVHVVAFVLYLLDRFSPFGRLNASEGDNSENSLDLSSAMWFSWGVILNSGIGEGTPRSFSARVLGIFWAGFAMIIISSYTANLAAFLVLDRPEASITGINDPRLRNPMDNFRYATVKNSGADMYFRRQVDLSTMARTMEGRNYDNAQEAIKGLKNGSLHAFIWDSPRLEYEASQDCDLVTAGELFGRSAFSVGLQKNSYWTDVMTQAILQFHEHGEMEKLDFKWILVQSSECPQSSSAAATLRLVNMEGVFMMVAGGIVAGVFLIIFEIVYRRREMRRDRQTELARNAAVKWQTYIEKRRSLRKTKDFIEKLKGKNKSIDIAETTNHTAECGGGGGDSGGACSSALNHRHIFPSELQNL